VNKLFATVAVVLALGGVASAETAAQREQFIRGFVETARQDKETRDLLPIFGYAKDTCKIDVPGELLATAHEFATRYPTEYGAAVSAFLEQNTQATTLEMLTTCPGRAQAIGNFRLAIQEVYAGHIPWPPQINKGAR
jgi:hypothetical protein